VRVSYRCLAVRDRSAGLNDLGKWARLDAVRAGFGAAEELVTELADSVTRRTEHLMGSWIDAHHPTVLIHLDDGVGGSVDDRGELLPFVLQRLPELCAAKSDSQFVAGELHNSKAFAIQ
jgi:hypothetical protein